jgi:hypothetical protein
VFEIIGEKKKNSRNKRLKTLLCTCYSIKLPMHKENATIYSKLLLTRNNNSIAPDDGGPVQCSGRMCGHGSDRAYGPPETTMRPPKPPRIGSKTLKMRALSVSVPTGVQLRATSPHVNLPFTQVTSVASSS